MNDLPDDLSGINQFDLISSAEGQSARTEMVYDIVNFEHTNLTTGLANGAFGAALRFEDWKVLRGCVTLFECSRNLGTERYYCTKHFKSGIISILFSFNVRNNNN